MSRPASALRFGWLAIALSSLASCGGELIRLGDQSAAESAGGTDGIAGKGSLSGVAQGGASAGGGNGPGTDGGAAGSIETCAHRQVLASEVLWIGDSWIQRPGTQHTRVNELAIAADTIDEGEDYVNLALDASSMAVVAKQYDTRESGATKVKVILMDGGTWDPIAAQMPNSTVSLSAAIANSVATFQRFLAKVASDGTVEHIVYFLVPELAPIPGVATMRPQLQEACAASTVPCHFIDLQPYWQGHPEFTAADGIQSSAAGGKVIAELIWGVMQVNCIAQ
ncbi:MAG TPA: SGNH/GDSL hydrolase family protein [Polyangiaceae bacterium]|nr:SGNH/GDSL hydrolase family protein [Polyangiaceae bacterium]HYQ27548.1 SGNH/GDSL hydrolase family protein [Polyangiaceae bacterium]